MDKAQRKLFQQAEADQKVREIPRRRGNKRLGVAPESTDQQYCDKCYAVKSDGHCPACHDGKISWLKFCRKCLSVHLNSFQCHPWQPKQDGCHG